jgi:ribulose-phosphate 3-epimerase
LPSLEILPSLLAADFARLGQHIAQAEAGGATILHCDVMDGHFAPNLAIGVPIVESIRKITRATLDVHLMITNPAAFAPIFIQAGADCVSIHQEADPHLDRTLRFIQSEGARAGVVLNPSTPVETLGCVLELVDYVLLMSVNPGFGGQTLIPYALDKARQLRQRRERLGLDFAIEMDGGITLDNVGIVAEAGVDWLVAGSSVFHTPDPAAAVSQLRQAALSALAHRA